MEQLRRGPSISTTGKGTFSGIGIITIASRFSPIPAWKDSTLRLAKAWKRDTACADAA